MSATATTKKTNRNNNNNDDDCNTTDAIDLQDEKHREIKKLNHSFESRDGVERAVTIQSILVPAPIQQQQQEK